MTKTTKKKLVLGRETLRTLRGELANVRGGGKLAIAKTVPIESEQCSLYCPTETL